MELARLHRRFAALMAAAALVALYDGAGAVGASMALAGVGLLVACVWLPDERLGERLDHVWLVLALALAGRAVWSVASGSDAGVAPWIDLLLLLLSAEALKPASADNDGRLYGLAFALLVASTAYRPGLLFAIAFAAYVALAGVALMVGYLRRQAERYDVPRLHVSRRLLATTFALSGVVLVTSAAVFVTFPRVARGWMAREAGAGSIVAGFGDAVSLSEHGASIESNPEVVLRVEFPRGHPTGGVESIHWRGRSFDRFDGVRWASSPTLPAAAPWPDSYASHWSGPVVAYDVYAAPLEQKVLFGLHPLIEVQPRTAIEPYLTEAGDVRYRGSDVPVYRAWSKVRPPGPDALRDAPDRPGPAERYYLQLPRLPDRIHALADSLVRGASNRYDKVAAVETWLRTELDYTRELPASELDAGLDAFLFQRRAGHCEYFSTAMAVMLRSVGIPARNVTGFLGGDWNGFGEYLLVSQDRAHSWVEVWFSGYGWVPFDPTPAGSDGVSAPGSAFGRLGLLTDGLQHRWHKWVVDYNLQKQLALLRRASDFFSRNRGELLQRPEGSIPWRGPVSTLLALGAVVAVAAAVRRRGGGRTASTRLYLALRRRYRRAGFDAESAAPPLAFAEAVHAAGAPGADAADRLVRLYVRTRFGPDGAEETDVAEMRALLRQASRALRRG